MYYMPCGFIYYINEKIVELFISLLKKNSPKSHIQFYRAKRGGGINARDKLRSVIFPALYFSLPANFRPDFTGSTLASRRVLRLSRRRRRRLSSAALSTVKLTLAPARHMPNSIQSRDSIVLFFFFFFSFHYFTRGLLSSSSLSLCLQIWRLLFTEES